MIEIVDYEAGNLTSVKRALDHLGVECRITNDPTHIREAERVIFPGVGAAGAAMRNLRDTGLAGALREAFNRGTPLMGICVGTQVLLTESEEDGGVNCLDLIPGRTVRFELDDPSLKIPHMGWNGVSLKRPHPVLGEIAPEDEFYFVHSYYPRPDSGEHVFAVTEYDIEFPAAIGRDNLIATQFHPEKSGPIGLAMLERFTQWDGKP